MASFNNYFANHFAACRLLAYAKDEHRQRDVRIYLVPGHWDCVGITDGTDSWVAPVIQGHNYFRNVDVWQMLADLQSGKELPPPRPLTNSSARRRLVLDETPEPQPEPQPHLRRRHVEVV